MRYETITIAHSTIMTMTYGFALMLIEHMERCCIGFGRTGSMLVLVHVWIRMCHCLVYVRCTMTQSQLHTRLLFNYNGNCTRLCTGVNVAWMYGTQWQMAARCCWLNVWNGISSCCLWANRRYVGEHWCIFESECVFTWCTLRHEVHYRDYTHHAIQIQWQWHAALRWCWLNIWNGVVLVLDEQYVRWYWCMFEFKCVITWYTMHYNTITIAHSPTIQLQWQ